MPETGSMILREARETANLSREQLSMRMECISVGTIKRWEYGESKPDSADVARMGEILNDSTLWPRWMCAVDDEYARRHPYSASDMPAAMAFVRVGYEMADVQKRLDEITRDALDGKIDNKTLAAQMVKELLEMEAASQEARRHLKEGS